MVTKRQLRRQNEDLTETLRLTREALDHSLITARIAAYAIAENIEPTTKDVEKFAKDYPQWRTSWGIERDSFDRARVIKTFTRTIGDLRPELHDDQDTYYRLGHDYLDDGLIDVFRKTCSDPRACFSGYGFYRSRADSGFAGGEISVRVGGEAALTRLDLIRVDLAEQYLADENLFTSEAALGQS